MFEQHSIPNLMLDILNPSSGRSVSQKKKKKKSERTKGAREMVSSLALLQSHSYEKQP